MRQEVPSLLGEDASPGRGKVQVLEETPFRGPRRFLAQIAQSSLTPRAVFLGKTRRNFNTYRQFLTLKHCNMAQGPQSLPQGLLLQPYRPLHLVLTEWERKQRIRASDKRCSDGRRGHLVLEDVTPFFMTEARLMVVNHVVEAKEVVSQSG